MATEVNGLVGPLVKTDGVAYSLRGDKQGATVVTDAHGKYHEAGSRGKIFMLDSDSVTLAAAHTTKSAGGTIKFVTGIYNPVGSGFNASIISSLVALVSGTATGPFVYNHFFTAGVVATSAASGTIRSALLGSGSVMPPQVNAAITLTGSATTAFTQTALLGGPAAIAAGAGINSVYDEVAGRIIVPPGAIFGICQVGASTAVAQATMWWEEVAV